MKRRPFFILIPLALFLLASFIVMLLWNWLIPIIFGLKTITFIQAGGLLILSKILFGSFCFGRKHRLPFANPEIRNKWMKMTDEERKQFKDEWKNRCH